MRNEIIILLGIALFAGGLFNIQNELYGFACCFLGGYLIGVGVNRCVKS